MMDAIQNIIELLSGTEGLAGQWLAIPVPPMGRESTVSLENSPPFVLIMTRERGTGSNAPVTVGLLMVSNGQTGTAYPNVTLPTDPCTCQLLENQLKLSAGALATPHTVSGIYPS